MKDNYCSMSTVDSDARYLARLLTVRQRQWPQVQDDLETIYNELQQQMRVASVNHTQWTHLSDENFLLATPASKVLDTVRLLKGALSAREEIAQHVNALFRRAFDTLTANEKEKSEQRFQELLEKIEAHARELASLKQQIEEKDRIEKVEQPEQVDVAMAEDNPVRAEVDLNNAVYWEPLVSDESDEDKEDDDLDLRSVAEEEEDEAAVIEQEMIAQEEARKIELRRRVEDLQNWVDRMRRGLRDFSFRKREIQSPGMCSTLKCAFREAEGEHFSDFCPIVTNGD
ncbi:unnamed protein product [Heligmosomoides polygyrus]|uniref:ING domain-containing protein n=1 Tax=Heligmosomoides polygyrus TaxID=6339 RepID=A0A183GDR1_HELPZ|nr:unnamed protein product [Heligmosomoides polygyrus]